MMVLRHYLYRQYQKIFFKTREYWNNRYLQGGDSGAGSYNLIAKYKSDFINAFIMAHDIRVLLDYGCGDGNQCSMINVQKYIGIDISEHAIDLCRKRYKDDINKSFYHIDDTILELVSRVKPELAISLDVIYHLVAQKEFRTYINYLFSFSEKYVIIFATNFDKRTDIHQVNRNFTTYVSKVHKNWKLQEFVENPYKGDDSIADFFIYRNIYNT